MDVLVADDNSPDGTGEIADELAAADPQVHVLHRPASRASARRTWPGSPGPREHGYDAVVEMDADGSHAPEELPRLLDALPTPTWCSAPAGSGAARWSTGRCTGWLLSRGGNLYARLALGMPIKDATGGYRAYRMTALDKIDIATVASQGYCFQVDLAWRAYRSGFRVVEVPITFAERERGASKMSSSIVREALWRVTVWGSQARLRSARARLSGTRSGRLTPCAGCRGSGLVLLVLAAVEIAMLHRGRQGHRGRLDDPARPGHVAGRRLGC